MKTMTMDGLGCKSREDADKILHMVVAQDDEAFRQFQILHLPTRDCRWFKKGQRLYVEETASVLVRAASPVPLRVARSRRAAPAA